MGPATTSPSKWTLGAPLDDADPLEEDTPCLTIGQIDPKEEEALIIAMKNRAYDAINSYRTDSYYRVQIPTNAEAQIDYLINEYRSVSSSNLTGRPPCNIDPIRIPLKEGVSPVQSRAPCTVDTGVTPVSATKTSFFVGYMRRT